MNYNGKLKVAKMDVDANTETSAQVRIRGISYPDCLQQRREKWAKKWAHSPNPSLSAFIDSVI